MPLPWKDTPPLRQAASRRAARVGSFTNEKPVGVTTFLPDSRIRHISSTSAISGA